MRLTLLNRIVQLYSKTILTLLKTKVVTTKSLKKDLKKPALVVSNHLSYLDILVMCSQAPMSFVTSVEMKETAFLGWIVRLAGCVFVERRNRENLNEEIHEITGALQSGHHVVIFPEATSTNGDSLLRFRTPLFQAAINANADIKVLALNYNQINKVKVTKVNRDVVCWYDDMTFLPHLFQLVGCRSIRVLISEGPRLKPPYFLDKKELAQSCFNEVEQLFKPFTLV